jgi:uncharacterized membrane protein YeaQ/YmgE (transglycosylase-associated protein family)
MLIFGILGWGIIVGGLAQLILRRDRSQRVDWGIAILAGIGGSFVGGTLASLIAGDGFNLRVSGFIGSLVGALIITGIWQYYARKKDAELRAAQKKQQRSGRHH